MKTVINFQKWEIKNCYYKVTELDGNSFVIGDTINVNGQINEDLFVVGNI